MASIETTHMKSSYPPLSGHENKLLTIKIYLNSFSYIFFKTKRLVGFLIMQVSLTEQVFRLYNRTAPIKNKLK